MNDHEMNVVRLALEAAYDTLKQPPSAYLDEGDFELDREDAVDKVLEALNTMGVIPERIPTGLYICTE